MKKNKKVQSVKNPIDPEGKPFEYSEESTDLTDFVVDAALANMAAILGGYVSLGKGIPTGEKDMERIANMSIWAATTLETRLKESE